MAEDWKLTGLVVPFNRVIRGGTRGGGQIFQRGCFAASLRQEPIIDLCVNHAGSPRGEAVADTTDGLFIDERHDGLYFVAWPSSSIFAKRAMLAVLGGRVRGCSFACFFEDSTVRGDVETVRRATLVEVSLCSNPACRETWCRAIGPQQLEAERLERSARFTSLTKRNCEYANV
jgi:HK97 family phage prohead protease